MAKFKQGAKPKRSKLAEEQRRNPLFTEEQMVGSEPIWNAEETKKMTPDEFESKLRQAMNYYNYFFTIKDMRKHLAHWAKDSKKFTTEQLARFGRSSDMAITMTACSIAKAHQKGMPLNEKLTDYLLKTITSAIDTVTTPAPAAVAKKGAVKAPTIQDRLAEKTSETIGELEGEVDNAFFGTKPLAKIYDFLTVRNVPQSQIGKIRAVFQKQADELAEALTGKDKDLKEAYSYLTKKQIARINEFYTNLLADLDTYVNAKKAIKKVRAVKTVSKEKLIARVKYMKENKDLKVVSISPMMIIGAKVVWTYQTKYRKLQRYVADDHVGTLGIKGTTIVGFDEAKSVGKTLRKPAEQLAAFMKAGKIQLRTFLKDIKATETKANGRLSEDVLILKVE